MKTVGFPISQKYNERRRCLVPKDIVNIKNKKQIYIEEGYGNVLGYTDNDYREMGVNVVLLDEVLTKDIICDAKVGDAKYLNTLSNQIIYGWIHAVQNKEITNTLIKNNITAYAWEDMFEQGRHVFWRNNEIAGEAAIIHAFLIHGLLPRESKVAVLGKGNTSKGAVKVLTLMGAEVSIYDRRTEKLFQKEINKFDAIVNCVLWDTDRSDHIISKKDLVFMKKNSLIIDVSCDKNGAIETCIPTSIDNPIYEVENIVHYAVDHTPSIFFKSISNSLSEIVSNSIDKLIESNLNIVLKNALIIENGIIKDERINKYQKRPSLI